MSEMTLKPNEKLDVRNILKDLDKYEPKRRGWTWRKPAPNLEMGPFTYHDVSVQNNNHHLKSHTRQTLNRPDY